MYIVHLKIDIRMALLIAFYRKNAGCTFQMMLVSYISSFISEVNFISYFKMTGG